MDNVRLPAPESATAKGLRSGAVTTITSLAIFASGLLVVLNGVPGCTDALLGYLRDNALQFALLIGVPSGIVTFIVSILRPSVKQTY